MVFHLSVGFRGNGTRLPRVGIQAMTLALPVSQIGITMLVSVENLEEAGEHVSFWLQIRRYWTGEHSYPPAFS